VKKEIPEFRSYLVAHVGSLNLRLNTALLWVVICFCHPADIY
jgi:hypothetical protein